MGKVSCSRTPLFVGLGEQCWKISQMCLQTNSEMLGMKVFFFPVDIVLLGIGGGYEGTLLSRGDLDLFCFVGFACFQGATPLTQMNTHVRQQ